MPNSQKGETSVCRTSCSSEQKVGKIGDREVAIMRGKPILGRADILTLNVLSKNLQVNPSEPPLRHANITGWPDEKSKQLQIAVELAADAKYFDKLTSVL